MTDTSDATDQNSGVIAEFRAHHGRIGGHFAGAPMLLLHTIGARTGRPRVNPVIYLPDNGRSSSSRRRPGPTTTPPGTTTS
jgi:hypothetical protein